MIDFPNFCRAAGLIPRDITPDGRWHRCPTESHPKSRNGAYKLMVDGDLGFVQDWAIHPEPLIWKPNASNQPTPIDRAAIQRRRAEERRQIAAAMRSARDYFDACKPLREGHPYLAHKLLDMAGCFGLRTDDAGWLVVPMHINGALTSVQRISPDGEKLFWSGAPTRGASYTIERRSASLTVICEGLATGLAIFSAVPTARVVVGFNAGNLVRVAEALPRRGMVVVAADNDLATERKTGINPGVKAAQEAAAVLGCGIAVPIGIAGTDWLDYRNEKIAERQQVYRRGRGVSESSIKKAVDAEISAAMLRGAELLREGDHA
ncbi:MAG: toprim domain-containing protein [Sulfuritalea sp.]|jgi:putative DNA primase/helicase|nr:toprim domain-containing protein [Sulfuritalea sp.]